MVRLYYTLNEAVDYLRSKGVKNIDESSFIQAGAAGQIPILVGLPKNYDYFIRVGYPDDQEAREYFALHTRNRSFMGKERALRSIEGVMPVNLAELITQKETQINYIYPQGTCWLDRDYSGLIESYAGAPEIIIAKSDLLVAHMVLELVLQGSNENEENMSSGGSHLNNYPKNIRNAMKVYEDCWEHLPNDMKKPSKDQLIGFIKTNLKQEEKTTIEAIIKLSIPDSERIGGKPEKGRVNDWRPK